MKGFESIYGLCEAVPGMNRTALEALVNAGALDDLGDRARLLKAVDGALRAGKAAAKGNGQASLFGDAPMAERPPPAADPMSDADRAAGEKETLGFTLVPPKPPASSPYATPGWRERMGEEVVVAGRVSAIREIQDRKNRTMAFLSLEDAEGPLEATLFARIWDQARDLFPDGIEAGTELLLRGKVENGKHGPSLVVARAMTPTEADRMPVGEIIIRLAAHHLGKGPLDALRALLSRSRGSAPVTCEVPSRAGPVARVRLGDEMTAHPSASLARAIDALLEAPGSCRFVPPAPREERQDPRAAMVRAALAARDATPATSEAEEGDAWEPEPVLDAAGNPAADEDIAF